MKNILLFVTFIIKTKTSGTGVERNEFNRRTSESAIEEHTVYTVYTVAQLQQTLIIPKWLIYDIVVMVIV